MSRAAVFLDRDDTLVRNADLPTEAWGGKTPGDLLNPAYVELLPGVYEACVGLKRAGYALVVVTNQGGVARGNGTMDDVHACNTKLSELLTDELGDALLDAFYVCPYHPKGAVPELTREHAWRKPNPGMIQAAAREMGLNLAESWMVGDAERDVQAGVNAGLRPTRCLRVGKGQKFPDLRAASEEILRSAKNAGGVRTAVALRARETWLLEDEAVERTVRSSAEGIAERTGVALVSLAIESGLVTATLGTHRLGALGFAAELRRVTDAWHERHKGSRLWVDDASPGGGG